VEKRIDEADHFIQNHSAGLDMGNVAVSGQQLCFYRTGNPCGNPLELGCRRHFGDVVSGYMYQEVYTQYNEAGDIIMGITPVNENIKEKNRETNYMTTTTSKEKPGKTPSKNDKKAPNTRSMEHRMRMREKLLALGKERGYKEGRLDGAIIWFSEGTLF
jgi:hypothetical protein